MARIQETSYYLKNLEEKQYERYHDLQSLYDRWKNQFDIKAISDFLDIIWKEKNKIKPKYLGENAYNNFRGIAFEEFCFGLSEKIIKETSCQGLIEPFWNEKILTEEFYVFEQEKGHFVNYPKKKAVDIALGKREKNLVHPLIIISCKVWQSANWLDEDRATFENIRNRYPNVIGYSLYMKLAASPVSLISAKRTGLKVFNLSDEHKFNEFVKDIKKVLMEIKDGP